MTDYTPPFPPAPWPTHSWPDMTIAQRKAFFKAWNKWRKAHA